MVKDKGGTVVTAGSTKGLLSPCLCSRFCSSWFRHAGQNFLLQALRCGQSNT